MRPYDFLNPWTATETKELQRYDAKLLRENLDGVAPCKIEQNRDVAMVVKLRKNLKSKNNAGEELEIFMSSFVSTRTCREVVAEGKGRDVVAVNIDNSARYDRMIPLEPVLKGLRLSNVS